MSSLFSAGGKTSRHRRVNYVNLDETRLNSSIRALGGQPDVSISIRDFPDVAHDIIKKHFIKFVLFIYFYWSQKKTNKKKKKTMLN